MLNKQLTAWEYVGYGFIEHKTERTGIDTATGTVTHINELDVAVLEHPELQALRHVVHLRRNHRIAEMQVVGKLLVDIEQGSSFCEALSLVVVPTANLEHRP